MTKKQKLVVIVGPTASGKTALSIMLAKRFGGEVISADSRQVYCGLDIGTEKVSPSEMDGVPHHLINVVDPTTVYTAADFARDAADAINALTARNHLPIVAGGTFFYIDALLGTVELPAVPPDPELRAQLEQLPAEKLFASLQHLDSTRAATIDRHNKRRLIRALEIVKALGSVPPNTTLPESEHEQYDVLWLGIKTDKNVLRARLRARAAAALERGLIEETKQLLENGVSKERLMEIGLEYALVIEFLEEKISSSELLQKLEEKNWQYAKRQLMWLKRNEKITWFSREDTEMFMQEVEMFVR